MAPPESAPLRRSIVARMLALLALAAAIVVVVVVVTTSLDVGEESGSSGGGERGAQTSGGGGGSGGGEETPKRYVVEPGDSLTSIADRFGISVKRIERLNPDVDPQALSPGQELTLR